MTELRIRQFQTRNAILSGNFSAAGGTSDVFQTCNKQVLAYDSLKRVNKHCLKLLTHLVRCLVNFADRTTSNRHIFVVVNDRISVLVGYYLACTSSLSVIALRDSGSFGYKIELIRGKLQILPVQWYLSSRRPNNE